MTPSISFGLLGVVMILLLGVTLAYLAFLASGLVRVALAVLAAVIIAYGIYRMVDSLNKNGVGERTLQPTDMSPPSNPVSPQPKT